MKKFDAQDEVPVDVLDNVSSPKVLEYVLSKTTLAYEKLVLIERAKIIMGLADYERFLSESGVQAASPSRPKLEGNTMLQTVVQVHQLQCNGNESFWRHFYSRYKLVDKSCRG